MRVYRPDSCSSWFFDWLTIHQGIHGSRYWVAPDAENALTHYRGWIEAFDRWSITAEEAQEVTRRLQEADVPGPNKQLTVIKDALYKLRKSRRAKDEKPVETRSSEEITAEERSAGCPECSDSTTRRATGWGRRRFRAHGFPWPLFVELYCRCPLGRFRERSAPDRDKGEDRHFSDLQLLMELWDGRLAHDSWDWSPPSTPSYHRQGDAGSHLTPREAEAYRQPNVAALKAMKAGLTQSAPPPPRAAWPTGDPILEAEKARRQLPAPVPASS